MCVPSSHSMFLMRKLPASTTTSFPSQSVARIVPLQSQPSWQLSQEQ